MKPSSNVAAEIDRQNVTGKTMKAYLELATKCSKKKTLTEEQKSTIKGNWKGTREKKNKKKMHKATTRKKQTGTISLRKSSSSGRKSRSS